MSLAFREEETFMPTPHDIEAALRSSKELASLSPKGKEDVQFIIKRGEQELVLVIPAGTVRLLLGILTQISEGNAVFLLIGLGLYQRFSSLAEKDLSEHSPDK